MVILVDNIVKDLVSLLFKEVWGPDYLGQEIIHFDKLSLSWTIGVQFLFTGLEIFPYCYYGHEYISVSPYVNVHCKWCINVPLYISRVVNQQYQW